VNYGVRHCYAKGAPYSTSCIPFTTFFTCSGYGPPVIQFFLYSILKVKFRHTLPPRVLSGDVIWLINVAE
jgi:hypothetical protein